MGKVTLTPKVQGIHKSQLQPWPVSPWHCSFDRPVGCDHPDASSRNLIWSKPPLPHSGMSQVLHWSQLLPSPRYRTFKTQGCLFPYLPSLCGVHFCPWYILLLLCFLSALLNSLFKMPNTGTTSLGQFAPAAPRVPAIRCPRRPCFPAW